MQQSNAILIAAKSTAASRRIVQTFETANFLNPVYAVDSVAALDEFIKHSCPRLVLVDLGMSQAWEILEKLRAARDGCGYPVMALIDEQTEKDLDRAYDSGVKSYLRGPFTFSEFLNRSRLMELHFVIEQDPPQ